MRIVRPGSKLCSFSAFPLAVACLVLVFGGCAATANSPSGPADPAPSLTAPANLEATAASATQINLSWTDTNHIAGVSFAVERCSGAGCSSFAQIATTLMASYSDSRLTPSTAYSYRVRTTRGSGVSGYSNTASAATQTALDTTPPTAPTNLLATASSSTQVGLSWTASTDNVGVTGYRVERCAGAGCGWFVQIATVGGTTTSYSDSGLTASTSYSYRVRATDAAGNLSGYSNVGSATTPSAPDTTPPTAPTSLMATASSSTQIGLTWTASTDNVGVSGYLVERCSGASCGSFVQIATVGGTTPSYSDGGLTASTSYSYRVRATDAAGNLSGYSNVGSATTQSSPDTTPPTAPANLVATASSSTQIGLMWAASTDNVGVTGYHIERCAGAGCSSFAQIATVGGTTTMYSDTGLTASTSYSYRVRANDAAGNLSGYSNVASATTQSSPDTTPPTAPTSLVATASSSTQIGLMWAASTDNVGVTGYHIERCAGAGCSSFAQIATVGGTTTMYSDAGLTASTSYSYRVRANDAAGNLSGYSNVASATTQSSPDTTPPTAPANLVATASSSTQIGLMWTASTDNVGVTGYLVERCSGASCSSFVQIASVSGTTTVYSDTGLTVGTSYSYRVRATDAAGNLSGYSNVAMATPPDTTPPTSPTGLTATDISSTQINLSWTASTDNVGVTGYLIESCSGSGCSSFAQIASVSGTTTSYSNTGLTASTSYSYRVRATDAASNLSPYSNTASATTSSSGGSGITVTVSPKRGGLTVSQTLSIAATLTGDTGNQGANWSFTSTGSTAGGKFSAPNTASGTPVMFTAPGGPGVVTITATAAGDGTKTASATIGVTDLAGVTTYLNSSTDTSTTVTRQGNNTHEYALTTSGTNAVNSTNFGKLFSCPVDAAIYPQPLWVANLTISGATHNVVFVATEHDTIYAFDADSNGNPCTPLWTASLIDTNHGGASGETWVTSSDDSCTDIDPDVGIVGTPVIDLNAGNPNASTLYVVSKSRNSGSFFQRIHALDVTTGNEKFSGPTTISAKVSGTGSGSSGGQVSFDPLGNNQRPALLLTNGHVIVTWASHCDNTPYHGWVMSYSASTLGQEAVWNASPNGINTGIWMSASGPAADAGGNIYLATGNGKFDVNTGGQDYGDSIIKLGPPSAGTFAVLSYFRGNTIDLCTSNFSSCPDNDQGSGGVMLFPAVAGSKNYLVQSGKDGNIYVMDSANLGGYNASSNNIVQELSGGAPGGMWGSPTYWNGSVFFGPAEDGFGSNNMIAYSFDTTSTATLSTSTTSWTSFSFAFPGPTSPISSNGTSSGIVWALENQNFCTTGSGSLCGPTVLHAYDATNLATEFWNSGSTAGNAVKFTVPTVANGKVYIGTRGNNTGGDASSTTVPGELDVYGLLPN